MDRKTKIIWGIVIGVVVVAIVAFLSYYFVARKSAEDTSGAESVASTSQEISSTGEKSDTPKLVFIHHSTGENWLADEDGGLGEALADAGYFVSDTNYGWGPDAIGDRTDIGNWWEWFRSPSSNTYLNALYELSDQNSEYSRLSDDPGGENEIIMFKSCFPNSNLGSSGGAAPSISNNPLKGEVAETEAHTVENAKGIYIDLLEYFKSQPDKLFIAVTAPPLGKNNTSAEAAANARSLNNWLVNDWLENYDVGNVAVFDFYNVLTGGESNFSQYSTDSSDDHPNSVGNQLATQEFISFLNSVYNDWVK